MARKIQFKRGLKADLPKLSPAELAFTTDEKKAYIGDGNENIRLLDQKDMTELTASLEGKASKQELERIGSATPKGTYLTLVALQTAFPTGTTGIYVVQADGKWYFWNGTAWTVGGQYQSTGLADKSVTPKNLDESIPLSITSNIGIIPRKQNVNLFNKDRASLNSLLNEVNIGEIVTSTGWATSDFIAIEANREVSIAAPRRILEYDFFKNPIRESFRDITNSADTTLTTTNKTKFIRYSTLTSGLNTAQVKYGSGTTRRYPYKNKVVLRQDNGEELYVDNVVNHPFEIKAGGKNLFNKNTSSKDQVLYSAGLIMNSTGWNTSDFIEVPQGNAIFSSVRYIHQYDKYKEPIVDSFVDLGNNATNHVLAIHPNAKYIRFSYFGSGDNLQVEQGNVATGYEAFYYAAYVEGRKVYDLVKSDAIEPVTPSDINLSAIDYGKVNLKDINIISDFNSGWVDQGGAGIISDDTDKSTYGLKSIKLSADNGTAKTIMKTVNVNLNDKILTFKVYVENKENAEMLQIFFGNEGFTDYFAWYYPVSRLKNGWNIITEPVSNLSKKGTSTPDNLLSNVKTARIYFKAKSGVSSSISLDLIGTAENAIKKGKFVIVFDDGHKSVWQYAKPALDKYGFRAVVPTIKDLVEHPDYMTMEQLKILYDKGWDITTHGQRPLTSMTREQLKAEFESNFNYIYDNGFTRSAKHYVSHQGGYNEMAIEEMKRFFITHRTTEFRYVTLPVADKFRLGNLSGNESGIDLLKAYTDFVEKNKVVGMINWHEIVESNPTGNHGLASVFREFVDYVATKNIDVVTMCDIFNPLD